VATPLESVSELAGEMVASVESVVKVTTWLEIGVLDASTTTTLALYVAPVTKVRGVDSATPDESVNVKVSEGEPVAASGVTW